MKFDDIINIEMEYGGSSMNEQELKKLEDKINCIKEGDSKND